MVEFGRGLGLADEPLHVVRQELAAAGILIATVRLSLVSRAFQTEPKAPSPSSSRRWKWAIFRGVPSPPAHLPGGEGSFDVASTATLNALPQEGHFNSPTCWRSSISTG
jgi:hypothetical protein